MRLCEVVSRALSGRQILNEGQAERFVTEGINSINNIIDQLVELYNKRAVESDNPPVTREDFLNTKDMSVGYLKGLYGYDSLPTTWKVIVAKVLVAQVAAVAYIATHPEGVFGLMGDSRENTQTVFGKLLKKLKNKAAFLMGAELTSILSDGGSPAKFMMSHLLHYLGIPYQKIRTFNPLEKNYDNVSQFLNELKALEEEFIAELGDQPKYVMPMGTERVLVDLGQRKWIALGRGQCDMEGGAMGHCGNSSGHVGDEIFSLRTVKNFDGQEIHIPHLTFIYNNGFLGEMKGRANEKPAARYHGDIIELLKLPIVKGIVSGGWEPENNFELSDLTEVQQEEVLSFKGHDFFAREGDVEQVLDSFLDEWHDKYTESDQEIENSDWSKLHSVLNQMFDESDAIGEDFPDLTDVFNDDRLPYGRISISSSEADNFVTDELIKVAATNELSNRMAESLIMQHSPEYIVYLLPRRATDKLKRWFVKNMPHETDLYVSDMEDIDNVELLQLIGNHRDEGNPAFEACYSIAHEAMTAYVVKNISEFVREAWNSFADTWYITSPFDHVTQIGNDITTQVGVVVEFKPNRLRHLISQLKGYFIDGDKTNLEFYVGDSFLRDDEYDFDEDTVLEVWKNHFSYHGID